MYRFILAIALVVSFCSQGFGAALITPAFSKFTSAGMSVDAGKQGTNTMQVIGATFSKPNGKPTMTVGPWVDVRSYSSLSAAVSAIGSAQKTIVIPADITVSANIVIPANIELLPLNLAKINHSTYTISGPGLANTARWPLAHVFNGTGAILDLKDVKAVWFGAKGDGVTNDTTALRRWAVAISGSGAKTASCLPGTYRVSQAGWGVTFDGLSNVVINLNNATFKALDGDTVAGNQAGFLFTNCFNVIFENGTYDGNRATRAPAEVTTHNINIGTSCSRLTFRNIRSINAACDGWYLRGTPDNLSTYPTDIIIQDCEGLNSYRNNLSAIGTVRLKIIRGKYNGANGTAPESGIDIEPNIEDVFGNTDFDIVDVEASNNGTIVSTVTGMGLTIAGPTPNANGKIVGLRGNNNSSRLFNVGDGATNIKVSRLVCGNHATASAALVAVSSGASKITLTDLYFEGITTPVTSSQVLLRIQATGTVVRGVTVKNSSLPVIDFIVGDSEVSGISATDITATAPAITVQPAAQKVTLNDVVIKRSNGYGIYWDGANGNLSNAYVEDSASTVSAIRFASSSTGTSATKLKIHQTVSVPVGSNAIRVDAALSILRDVAATGGYTDANTIFGVASLFTSSSVSGINPDPFAKTFTYDPPSLAAGGTTTTTFALSKASFGDGCVIHAPYDLQGVISACSVSSSGAFRISLYNPTGTVDLASGSWKISLKKD